MSQEQRDAHESRPAPSRLSSHRPSPRSQEQRDAHEISTRLACEVLRSKEAVTRAARRSRDLDERAAQACEERKAVTRAARRSRDLDKGPPGSRRGQGVGHKSSETLTRSRPSMVARCADSTARRVTRAARRSRDLDVPSKSGTVSVATSQEQRDAHEISTSPCRRCSCRAFKSQSSETLTRSRHPAWFLQDRQYRGHKSSETLTRSTTKIRSSAVERRIPVTRAARRSRDLDIGGHESDDAHTAVRHKSSETLTRSRLRISTIALHAVSVLRGCTSQEQRDAHEISTLAKSQEQRDAHEYLDWAAWTA